MSTDLGTTFLDAERYFNAGDWDALDPLLHSQVKMWHVDDRYAPIIGKADVMTYLRTHPQSFFYHQPQGPLASSASAPGASTVYQGGVVQGTAYWKDIASASPVLIRYVFTFDQDSSGQWTIRTLKGWII